MQIFVKNGMTGKTYCMKDIKLEDLEEKQYKQYEKLRMIKQNINMNGIKK